MNTRRLLCLLFAVLLALPSAAAETGPEPAPPAPDRNQARVPGQDIPDWQARLELARLLSWTKRYTEAVAEYEKVLAEKPDLAEAKLELARVLSWAGKNDRSLAILRSMTEDRLDPESRILLADLAAAGKDYATAERYYRQRLQDRPDDLKVRLKLAEVLSWTGRYKESVEEYKTLIAALPDDVQLRRKYAQVLSWSGNREEAIRELEKTLRR